MSRYPLVDMMFKIIDQDEKEGPVAVGYCLECGPVCKVDEDGCCAMCGQDACGKHADKALDNILRIEILERNLAFADALAIARGQLIEWMLSEIDCRIAHGADSNGHLEGLKALFMTKTADGHSAGGHDD